MITEKIFPYYYGTKLINQKRHIEAIKHLSRMRTRPSSLHKNYFLLGKCYFEIGKNENAKLNLHRALELSKDPSLVKEIIEITNWNQVSSHNYFNSCVSFSPNSEQLVFVSARRDTNGDGIINDADCGGIYIYDMKTKQERCVVPDLYYNSQPIFSADGKKLAYLSSRQPLIRLHPIDNTSHKKLYFMDLETGQEKELLDSTYSVRHVKFDAKGDKIIFSGWRQGDRASSIYAVSLITGKIDVLISGNFENTFPSMSNSGDRIVYSSWRRDTNQDGIINITDNSAIFVRDIRRREDVEISSDRYNNLFPSFSKCGNKVLFLSVRRDTNNDGFVDNTDNPGIYVYDLEEKREYCIVGDSHYNKFASFSPDTKNIIFVSNRNNLPKEKRLNVFHENKGIYSINTEDKAIKRVVSDAYYGTRMPVISPKGDCVAYLSWRKNTNRGLYLAYLDQQPNKEELHKWINKNL